LSERIAFFIQLPKVVGMVVVAGDDPAEGRFEPRSVIGLEAVTVALMQGAQRMVLVEDGVRQATDPAHHRDGPVAQSDQLGEPAGLELTLGTKG
jgi:hypothetical protein